MIKVIGDAIFSVPFEIVIDMTEDAWDALSQGKQEQIIDDFIGMESFESSDIRYADVSEIFLADEEGNIVDE